MAVRFRGARAAGGRRGGGARRGKDWEYAIAQIQLAGGVTATLCDWLIPPTYVRENYTDPTLMATRWFVNLRLGNAGATANALGVAVGIIAWDGIDDSAPLASECPGPITHGDLDWITRFAIPVPSAEIGASYALVLDTTHLSEARRKLGNQTSLLISAETFGTGAAPPSATIGADVRMLLMDS